MARVLCTLFLQTARTLPFIQCKNVTVCALELLQCQCRVQSRNFCLFLLSGVYAGVAFSQRTVAGCRFWAPSLTCVTRNPSCLQCSLPSSEKRHQTEPNPPQKKKHIPRLVQSQEIKKQSFQNYAIPRNQTKKDFRTMLKIRLVWNLCLFFWFLRFVIQD